MMHGLTVDSIADSILRSLGVGCDPVDFTSYIVRYQRLKRVIFDCTAVISLGRRRAETCQTSARAKVKVRISAPTVRFLFQMEFAAEPNGTSASTVHQIRRVAECSELVNRDTGSGPRFKFSADRFFLMTPGKGFEDLILL